MSNIEELKKEIERHKAEIERIEKQLEEKKVVKRWRAKERCGYFYIMDGDIFTSSENISSHCDDIRYNSGNYFQIVKEAENHKRRLLLTQQIKDIALELNAGKKIDWSNLNQLKYVIYFNYVFNRISQESYSYMRMLNATYCLSDKFLETVQSRISEEDLLFLFNGDN